jgi:hypothetical protein
VLPFGKFWEKFFSEFFIGTFFVGRTKPRMADFDEEYYQSLFV